VDVRWAPPVGCLDWHRVRTGLDREKRVAPFIIRAHPAVPDEVGIERGIALIIRMPITSCGIGLPKLDDRAAHRVTVLVEDPAAYVYQLSLCHPTRCGHGELLSPHGSFLQRSRGPVTSVRVMGRRDKGCEGVCVHVLG